MLSPTVLSLIVGLGVGDLQSDPIETQIYGGEDVEQCGWPSVVLVGGGCTGSLIHPQIVLTAAHCVTDGVPSEIGFGESRTTARQLAATEYCRQGPGWDGSIAEGEDYAYCKLATPVTDVPIIPVAGGCEQTAVYTGARIMHVGFGATEDGNGGRKKMLDTSIDFVTGQGEIISGDPGEVICNGDSGGPTFVYLDPELGGDGTWRVAAIHSWAQGADPVNPNCQGTAGSVMVTQAIDWIEEDSGIDITPCTDGDEWAPTAHCGNLFLEPWNADGSYTTGCAILGEVVEYTGICGPALDETPDDTPPVVEVVTPTQQEAIPSEGGSASVSVEIAATDEGWGVASVELTVRSTDSGQEQVDSRSEWLSWVWNTTLPAGAYEVEAVAIDHAGNASEPVIVCFGVDEEGCEQMGDEDGSGGSESGDSGDTEVPGGTAGGEEGSSSGAGAVDGGGGEQGCGCQARGRGHGAPAALLGMLVLGLARRRTRASLPAS